MISPGAPMRFSTEVGGKWILIGEHSVLQGACSVALPLSELSLRLSVEMTRREPKGEPVQKYFLDRGLEGVRRRVLVQTGIDLEDFDIKIDNQVPIGAGLGSSASLSVAISRFSKWLKPEMTISERELAQEIENEFHGKSSGMDISVVFINKPILFKNGIILETLEMQNQGPIPLSSIFSLHWTGRPKSTKEAIQRVQEWRTRSPVRAKEWDTRIDAEGQKIWKALKHLSAEGCDETMVRAQVEVISKGVEVAHQSFLEWGLIPADLLAQRQRLLDQGARAVKLTGAGLGGYWVAVWDPDAMPTFNSKSAAQARGRGRSEFLVDRPLAGF